MAFSGCLLALSGLQKAYKASFSGFPGKFEFSLQTQVEEFGFKRFDWFYLIIFL